jgi:hypothetical protein
MIFCLGSFYSLNENVSHGTKVLEIQTLLGEEKYPVPLPFKTLHFECLLDIKVFQDSMYYRSSLVST